MFLDTAVTSIQQSSNSGFLTGLLALGIVLFLVVFLLIIGIYIYMSFAFMAIAKKASQSSPGIAWIPGVGPLIIAFRSSKMHWWPWLLMIGFFIPFVNIAADIAFAIFGVIWMWKLFEVVKKPGWWAIFMVIPILNLVYLVFVGIAAWSSD